MKWRPKCTSSLRMTIDDSHKPTLSMCYVCPQIPPCSIPVPRHSHRTHGRGSCLGAAGWGKCTEYLCTKHGGEKRPYYRPRHVSSTAGMRNKCVQNRQIRLDPLLPIFIASPRQVPAFGHFFFLQEAGLRANLPRPFLALLRSRP